MGTIRNNPYAAWDSLCSKVEAVGYVMLSCNGWASTTKASVEIVDGRYERIVAHNYNPCSLPYPEAAKFCYLHSDEPHGNGRDTLDLVVGRQVVTISDKANYILRGGDMLACCTSSPISFDQFIENILPCRGLLLHRNIDHPAGEGLGHGVYHATEIELMSGGQSNKESNTPHTVCTVLSTSKTDHVFSLTHNPVLFQNDNEYYGVGSEEIYSAGSLWMFEVDTSSMNDAQLATHHAGKTSYYMIPSLKGCVVSKNLSRYIRFLQEYRDSTMVNLVPQDVVDAIYKRTLETEALLELHELLRKDYREAIRPS